MLEVGRSKALRFAAGGRWMKALILTDHPLADWLPRGQNYLVSQAKAGRR
jgi:hypothetical protein